MANSEKNWLGGRTGQIAWLIVGIGAALRLRGYLANHSLWLDELMIVRNILERSLADLFHTLEYGQNAPIAWRLCIKLVTLAFGESEYALRALPMAGAIAALPVMWIVSRRVLGPRWALLSLGLWAVSPPVINYAIQVKQYATDPLFALIIVWAALAWRDRPDARRSVLLGLVGIIAMLFSQPAIFVAGGVGIALFVHALRNNTKGAVPIITIGLIWSGAFVANYLLFIRLPADWRWVWLYEYWSEGFMPLPPRSLADVLWLPRSFAWAMRDTLGMGFFSSAAAVVFAIGLVALWQNRRGRLALIVMPIALALLASAIHAYPFAERLILFLAPVLVIVLAGGAQRIAGWLARIYHRLTCVPLVGVLAAPVFTTAAWLPHGHTISMEQARPPIAALAEAYQPGDAIIVPYWASYAWWYYAPRLGLRHDAAQILVRDDRDTTQPVVDALSSQNSARIWLLVTHFARRSQDGPDEFMEIAEKFGPTAVIEQAPGAALILIKPASAD